MQRDEVSQQGGVWGSWAPVFALGTALLCFQHCDPIYLGFIVALSLSRNTRESPLIRRSLTGGEQAESSAGSSVQGALQLGRETGCSTGAQQENKTLILASASLMGLHCLFTRAKRYYSAFVGSRQSWRRQSSGI